MLKKAKYIVASLAVAVLALGTVGSVNAAVVDPCNSEYTSTKTNDYDDARVNINFQDGDESITVTPKAGYSIVSVQLDVEDDGHGGFYTYPVVANVKFNPNPGEDIDSAKVVVKKVCTEVCNDTAATNYQALVPGQTVANNTLCQYPVPVVTTPTVENTTPTTPAQAPQVQAPSKAVNAGGGSRVVTVAALISSIAAFSYGVVRLKKFGL